MLNYPVGFEMTPISLSPVVRMDTIEHKSQAHCVAEQDPHDVQATPFVQFKNSCYVTRVDARIVTGGGALGGRVRFGSATEHLHLEHSVDAPTPHQQMASDRARLLALRYVSRIATPEDVVRADILTNRLAAFVPDVHEDTMLALEGGERRSDELAAYVGELVERYGKR